MIIQVGLLLLIGVFTWYFFYSNGGAKTLGGVFVPVMLLIPMNYAMVLFGSIPPLSFLLTTTAVLLFLVLYEESTGFRWGFIDSLVLLFCLAVGYVAYVTSGLQFALGFFLDKVLNDFLPYILIRQVIDRHNILRFLVAVGLSITFLAALAPFEAFLNLRLHRLLQYVWPVWVYEGTFKRLGFFRVYSSFIHPIHAGMGFSIGLFIAFACHHLKVFRDPKVTWIMMALCSVAMFLTVSRGSWVTAVPGILLIYFAMTQKKFLYGTFLVITAVLILSVAVPLYEQYLNPPERPGAGLDETQTSALYRAKLYENYMGKVLERPWLGYGAYVPIVKGQDSIDNYYLYLLLRYGIPTTVLFCLPFVIVFVLGLFRFFSEPQRKYQIILWTLMSILAFFAWSSSNVYFAEKIRVLLHVFLACTVAMVEPNRRVYPVGPKDLFPRWM